MGGTMMDTDFPKILTELIDGFGMRPVEIASRTGCGVMSVYRWKAGESQPIPANRDVIIKLYKREKAKREVQ